MSNFKELLEKASQKAIAAKAERRHRTIKGSHLTDRLLEAARVAGMEIRENSGFNVISGKAGKSVRIYVAKRGGLVDLLGFTIQDPAVIQISKEEAKLKHMGRVEGRLNFDKTDEEIVAVFGLALERLNVPGPVETPKAPRKPRAPKAMVEAIITEVIAPAVEVIEATPEVVSAITEVDELDTDIGDELDLDEVVFKA
jgi:hypothetical protein